ncbi:MAG: hypothetical protein ACLS3V_06655 [Streptococcus sp.]
METITSSSDNATEAGRHSTAQVTPVTEVTEQNLNGDAYLTDPETTKAAIARQMVILIIPLLCLIQQQKLRR